MPPHVPRKRLRDSSPVAKSSTKSTPKATSNSRRKPTLYDDLDATSTPTTSRQSAAVLAGLAGSDSDSSLTSLSDEEFEDVPPAKRQKPDESSDEDEDFEFEDVAAPKQPEPEGPIPSGDLELTLNKDTRISLTNPFGDKKGPSKRERKVRLATHSLHVLTLLWHNAVRNSWLCDLEVQATMISHLPPRLWDEVDRWRRSSGLEKDPPIEAPPSKGKGKGKAKAKGKAMPSRSKTKKEPDRPPRDWSSAADRLENGVADMSQGDPLFRLMQVLSSWWKQRFRVSTSGLRKWGYMSLERLDRVTKAYKSDPSNEGLFGERFNGLEDFRRSARLCRGSRDVGSQLFTALLRGLGLEARMVANLQTLGFGWSKYEDAEEEKDDDIKALEESTKPDGAKTEKRQPEQSPSKPKPHSGPRNTRASGKQTEPLVLEESDELELDYVDSDDESVVELEANPKTRTIPSKRYDSDLEYPHYWAEVLSPVSNQYLPVEPIIKSVIGTNRELIESLEPRGAKADKAREMMAYIVGYSPDGTAKDVTVRYLKKQMLPGRTKGVRLPLEKVPVYGRNGKVKKYMQYDWFKTAMSGYRRGTKKCPITEIDDLEDSTDLKPAQPEKKEVKEGEETLQYYKQSKEFVLERHLKREEALKSQAKPVKKFKNKAKGGKTEEEDVYLRSDVLQVKSAETWHKQGRAPIGGEMPLKRVPYRAATTNRRREIMEAEAATGEKVMQGLFSFEQTNWIIPPPIKDGLIPKNEYGNIDLFVEHMCPRGAVHVPFRGATKVCKRLQIDYAEAVVDFEFGHRMAVPVIQGVVVAEEYHDQVMEELQKDEVERARKEDEKRRKVALGTWRKFMMGMRIVERIRREYGEIDESVSVFAHSKGNRPMAQETRADDEEMAGGFLPEGFEVEEDEEASTQKKSSFFATAAEEGADEDDGLVMENHDV